jgi:hypothetical protein
VASYIATAEAALPTDNAWTREAQKARSAELTRLVDDTSDSPAAVRAATERVLRELQEAYIAQYLRAHERARLGVTDDRRKVALLRDDRVQRLEALSAVDLMPVQQLRDLRERLGSLKSCWALTEADIAASPICPHCGFRPAFESSPRTARDELGRIDEDVDTLLESWTRTLLANLEDPTSVASLHLLSAAEREPIEAFVRSKRLPPDLDNGFVAAVQQVLGGLQKISVSRDDLRTALVNGGGPCTLAELKTRFDAYLDGLAHGRDRDRIRVVLE